MNEDGAVQAVYDTIDDNSAALVSGLSQSGEDRALSWLADTMFDVPNAFYAVAIHCEGAEEEQHPAVRNTNAAVPYMATYRMMIRLGDAVFPDNDDVSYGSVAHTNFRDFCDKVVKLFRRDQQWFPSSTASPKFRLQIDPQRGRVVTKENDLPMSLEDGTPVVSATIRFVLTECGE